ncbi:MAG: UDP-N-acetylglucosamine 1-carboxyvinyltransferase [Parcubacteria group bacterium Gr01-1014_33]|nr:MAG: UDP-N-acetylglucosamine 1-carboxyvinyltransferase [Parcubacteria group bacterium Gr01-1014_33]
MNTRFIIHGGNPLRGELRIFGSKNTASKMMIASLLTEEECVIENVPFSGEIEITRELCEGVGSRITIDPSHICVIQTPQILTSRVPELSRKNRIPILAMGPLLHRAKTAEVPLLGGDLIGPRPIDMHLDAMAKMGVRIERRDHSYFAEAEKIRGADISLLFPSVGATENIILTATRAKGETIIRNAAVEPEILNLCAMLGAMGASIRVNEKKRIIRITGVERMAGTHWRVMPDRNEIVSFAVAALATGGDIFIPEIERGSLEAFLEKVTEIGAHFEEREKGIRFWGTPPYLPTIIKTGPHPGFMTDWASPFAVLLTESRGESILHETIYEDRFGYVKDLRRMGAEIEVSDECLGEKQSLMEKRLPIKKRSAIEKRLPIVSPPPCRFSGKTFNHSARFKGPRPLSGAEIAMTDIRAGMAHIIAALAAKGESVISGIEHIDRGYERIDERLRELGAEIKRVES